MIWLCNGELCSYLKLDCRFMFIDRERCLGFFEYKKYMKIVNVVLMIIYKYYLCIGKYVD